jgi:hypothetical protein
MATYSDTKVWAALSARLESLTFSPALPISWPNGPNPDGGFTPPGDRKWLRVNEIPASTTHFALSGGTNEHIGLLQVDVFRPLNEGHVPAKETGGAIAAHFPVALRLFSEGVKVVVTRSELGPVLKQDTEIMLPVTIRWRAFI